MKKSFKSAVVAGLAAVALTALVGCGGGASSTTVAVPSDPTNEGRALLLLQDQGLITLTEGVGLAATAACLLIFGKDVFLIPSMCLIAAILVMARKTGKETAHE